jgi:hypothetical protein
MYKALLAIGIYLIGSLMAGLAYTEPILGPGFGSFLFCLGGLLGLTGIVYFFVVIIKRLAGKAS